ncbi:MAG: efflux RND transporter periplasmic adaptor subunit [Gammaproteobacteria bacterium]|nr:efflux RND transporter periplasmic adaptor subunit [Gammaproteobacteria bacterium]MYK45555.1 efflux RND transporter periplasmic adaptor subunit [Gammaproteobacteria bacterium]
MNFRTISLILLGVVLGAVLGTVAVAFVAYNPAGWAWLEDTQPTPETAAAAAADQAVYTCGMHPNVTRTEPGNCPICGMKLVPKKPSGPQKDDESDTDVRVAPGFLQNFAVRTAVVERGTLPVSIRTVGVLAHNEEKLVSVNTKFEGWIETAHVNNVGESVAEGDVLFDIYSPQLVTTQREYLAAMAYVQQLEASDAYPDAIERATSLLEAASERLHYWDITDEQIDALERSGSAPRTIRFFSPASGFVVEKMGDSLEGMRLQPGMTVLKIADHSTLWAQAEFFESDLRHVREGSEVRIEVDAFPGRRWSGRILFFRSAVDPETRALTAFVEVDNADLSLRPMMYVDVSLSLDGAADAVLIPAEAVLHSGERSVVIVEKDDGLFEPREVSLGLAAEGLQEVTAGLSPGETVVVSSQFLIDSESNLKAATAQLLRGDEPDDEPDEPMPQHHHHHH